jgi:REP element-mobilizing transposase RayT
MVFCTKNRIHLLNSSDLRKEVFQHIKQNAAKKDIWLDCVNGWRDHAHCLISLGRQQSISTVAQLIKGESSFWINQNRLTEHKFTWQDDYWAVGISEIHIQSVRDYIHNQEDHHSAYSFEKEVNEFLEKYGWSSVQEDNTE